MVFYRPADGLYRRAGEREVRPTRGGHEEEAAEIDQTHPGVRNGTWRAIYEVERGTLTIDLNGYGGGDRPTAFEPAADPRAARVSVFRRAE